MKIKKFHDFVHNPLRTIRNGWTDFFQISYINSFLVIKNFNIDFVHIGGNFGNNAWVIYDPIVIYEENGKKYIFPLFHRVERGETANFHENQYF